MVRAAGKQTASVYTCTHINVTKINKEIGHEFELEQQGIWECLDWGKGNKKLCNFIIISKVKNCN